MKLLHTSNKVINICLALVLLFGQISPFIVSVPTAYAAGTFGVTTINASTDSNDSNTMNGAKYVAPETGTITSMSVYVGTIAAAPNNQYQLAIYADSAGAPGALIAKSATGTLTANSWNTIAVSTPVTANTNYWLMYNTNGNSASVNDLKYASGASNQAAYKSQAFGTWPTTFGAATFENAQFSMYATYTTDTTAPTVSITAPLDGSTVSGVATITADATDNVGVVGVQFKLDGANLGTEDTSSPYSVTWDTTTLIDAAHTITAVARDSAGNTTTSAVVNVSTHNPAKLKILAPANGSTIAGTTVNVSYAKYGDMTTEANHAHLKLDGVTKMDLDFDGSYQFTSVPAGSHTLIAIVARADHTEIAGSDDTVTFTTTVQDTTPPTVSITSPTDGSTVSNTTTLTVNATDNVGVTGVQYKLDGVNLGSEVTTAPYSLVWDSNTTSNGTHTLTAVAKDASANSATSTPVSITVSNTGGSSLVGQWSSVMNWPIVAVHANMMKNGKILMWDAWETYTSQAKVYDPVANTFAAVPVDGGLFCAGQAPDKDGNIVVVGGFIDGEKGIKDISVFNPDTNTWTKKTPMNFARWYPTATTLSDGRILAMSGQITSGTYANTPEIFDNTTNTMSQLTNANTSGVKEEQYPFDWQLPSGKVLVVSAEQGGTYLLDPATQNWTNVGTTCHKDC
jgi:hypothetical protein